MRVNSLAQWGSGGDTIIQIIMCTTIMIKTLDAHAGKFLHCNDKSIQPENATNGETEAHTGDMTLSRSQKIRIKAGITIWELPSPSQPLLT